MNGIAIDIQKDLFDNQWKFHSHTTNTSNKANRLLGLIIIDHLDSSMLNSQVLQRWSDLYNIGWVLIKTELHIQLYFFNRLVNDWNNSPSIVVDPNSVNNFKS